MSVLLQLKIARSASDLAHILGYEPKKLTYIAYKIPDEDKYTTFQIPKKTGGTREILAPTQKLKQLQSRISDLLYGCLEERYKNFPMKKRASHGFSKGLSIETNAKKHTGQRFVFNIDLQDFFPSINFGRVRGFLIKNHFFELDPKVATVIAQIACFKGRLPQGSPCSPIISNLIAQPLDLHLLQLAKNNHCTYSRYADDITFSSRSRSFPKAIAFERNRILSAIEKFAFRNPPSHNWEVGGS